MKNRKEVTVYFRDGRTEDVVDVKKVTRDSFGVYVVKTYGGEKLYFESFQVEMLWEG